MGTIKGLIIFLVLIVILAGGYLFLNRSMPEGTIIMTRISSAEDLTILNQQHLKGMDFLSSIVSFNPERPTQSPKNLTKDFAIAHSPELSKDSKQMVFTGKMDPDSNRQIWLMNLNSKRYHALTDDSMNCFDPFFLPNEHIAFSCDWQHEKYGSGSFMFSLDPENGQLKRITYHPHADHSGSMLHDGRILWVSKQIYPDKEQPTLMALRPDGTNANLFYKLPAEYNIISKARESESQQIFFTAINQDSEPGTSLFRFSYINPVTSTQKIFHAEGGSIYSIYPQLNGPLLISYQEPSSNTTGLFELNESKDSMNSLLKDDQFHYIEPIVVKGQPFVPKALPTALNDQMETGIIVFTEPGQNRNRNGEISRNTILVEDLNGLHKEFKTAEDGSFYIKTTAKVPIRFSQLDESGDIINGPFPWVWVMNGDRRGFNGWDPIQMIAPANLVPQAINAPPVQIMAPGPADLPFIVDFNQASEVIDED